MSRLHEMEVRGQSPWIHGLTRAMLDDGSLSRLVAAIIDQAARLYAAVGRRNFLVQVPATTEAVPAIEERTARGIPVEATLLYSARRHRETANAYLNGLRRLLEAGGSPARIASVASFDAEADRRLAAADGPEDLRGTFAVAHARLVSEPSPPSETAGGRGGPRWPRRRRAH